MHLPVSKYILAFAFHIYIVNVSLAKEPVCSKFSYEEQLLEKMIRTEIKVEIMENGIKKTLETVLDTLNEIKDRINDVTEKFNEFRNNITKEMEIKTGELELKKEKVEKGAVGFHANHVTDNKMETNKVIVFDRIITNEGSGYDTSTGVYTVPLSGMYIFSVHLCTSKNDFAHFAIVKEDTELSRGSHHDNSDTTCCSESVVASVKKGQRVWVKCTHGKSNIHLLHEDSYRWNSFSGALLKEKHNDTYE